MQRQFRFWHGRHELGDHQYIGTQDVELRIRVFGGRWRVGAGQQGHVDAGVELAVQIGLHIERIPGLAGDAVTVKARRRQKF